MEENKEIKEDEVIESNETNNTIQNNNQNLMPVKSNKGLVIGLVILVILLAGGLVYMLFFNKGKEEPQKNDINNTPTATPAPIEDNVTPTPVPQVENDADKKYELTVYKHKDGTITNVDKKNDDLEEALKIKVSSKNAKVLEVNNNGTKFLLYQDNGLHLYDVKTGNSRKLNLESNLSNFELYLNDVKDKVIGIGYVKEEAGEDGWVIGYYNVSLNKKLYDGKYTIGYLPMELQLTDDTIALRTSKGAYLLSANEEKIELSESNNEYNNYQVIGEKGSYIYAYGSFIDEMSIKKLYTNDKKLFYTNSNGESRYSYYNGYVYIADNDVIKKFNNNGELLYTSSKYDNLKLIENNYAIYIKSDEIYLENIDNQNEVVKIAPMKKDSYIWSSYYSREMLDEINEQNKKEGLYVVVEYDGKDSNGNYGMEYCYTTDHQIVEYPIEQEVGGRAKPVLYLYPEKETNVIVKFEKPNLLTTTYPKYINSWNVLVKPNGDMKDCDGKYYYALYWDEKRYNEVSFDEGFYVEGKDAIKFLEEKLTIIGLNDKERNEFIMYWLPILEKNEKNLVYFELTEERELGNKLIITPKPDSLLRVSVHIKKVNEKINIKEQKLPTFKRVGFTAVEWGGMTY